MDSKKSEKFFKLAENLTKEIEKKQNCFSGVALTPRRATFITKAQKDADRLKQIQKILYTLSKLWNQDIIGLGLLAGISSKTQIDRLLVDPKYYSQENYERHFPQLIKAGIKTLDEWIEARNLALSFCSITEEEEKTKKLKLLELNLINKKFHEFFPTPESILEKMDALIKITPNIKILEPSAGKGNIAEFFRNKYGVNIDVIELATELQEILKLKDFNVLTHDFLQFTGNDYDLIIMNPPFSKYQDIDHVYHAFNLLKSGGQLCSIMASSAFNNSHKKAVEFRTWLDVNEGIYEKLPDNSFKESERPTGVSSYMIYLNK